MMTVAMWAAGVFVGYRVARWVFAPAAKQWRERPVVMWSYERRRWEAAERLRGR
jgi:hypothetical protein